MLFLVGTYSRFKRLVGVRAVVASLRMMQEEVGARLTLQQNVQRLNILENGGISRSGVLQINRPFRRFEFGILDKLPADLQAGKLIPVDRNLFDPARVDPFA